MPSTVKQAMVADPMIELEFQKLLAAQFRLASVSESERAFIREEIADLEGLLRSVPRFSHYLDLRDGCSKGLRSSKHWKTPVAYRTGPGTSYALTGS